MLDLLGTWLDAAEAMAKQIRRKSIPLAHATIIFVLEQFMGQHETRDLDKLLLKPLHDLSWSSAPATHMAKMLEFADLWKGFIEKAPNGLLPPSATKKGIEACNAQGLINFTRMTSSNFADQVSVVIRQALSKLREVKDSAKILNATERKLGQSGQILKLRKLLDMMDELQASPAPSLSPSISPSRSRVRVDADGFPDFENLFLVRNDSEATVAFSDQTDSDKTASTPLQQTDPSTSNTGKGDGWIGERTTSCADLLVQPSSYDPVTPKEKRDVKANKLQAAGRGRSRGCMKRPAAKRPAAAAILTGAVKAPKRSKPSTTPAAAMKAPAPRVETLKKRQQRMRNKVHSKAYHQQRTECEKAGLFRINANTAAYVYD